MNGLELLAVSTLAALATGLAFAAVADRLLRVFEQGRLADVLVQSDPIRLAAIDAAVLAKVAKLRSLHQELALAPEDGSSNRSRRPARPISTGHAVADTYTVLVDASVALALVTSHRTDYLGRIQLHGRRDTGVILPDSSGNTFNVLWPTASNPPGADAPPARQCMSVM